MSQTIFSERVNVISNMITEMTPDPSERLGIVTALAEIYKHDLQKYLIPVPAKREPAPPQPAPPGSVVDETA